LYQEWGNYKSVVIIKSYCPYYPFPITDLSRLTKIEIREIREILLKF